VRDRAVANANLMEQSEFRTACSKTCLCDVNGYLKIQGGNRERWFPFSDFKHCRFRSPLNSRKRRTELGYDQVGAIMAVRTDDSDKIEWQPALREWGKSSQARPCWIPRSTMFRLLPAAGGAVTGCAGSVNVSRMEARLDDGLAESAASEAPERRGRMTAAVASNRCRQTPTAPNYPSGLTAKMPASQRSSRSPGVQKRIRAASIL
jgi:hypothetical protein